MVNLKAVHARVELKIGGGRNVNHQVFQRDRSGGVVMATKNVNRSDLSRNDFLKLAAARFLHRIIQIHKPNAGQGRRVMHEHEREFRRVFSQPGLEPGELGFGQKTGFRIQKNDRSVGDFGREAAF